MSNELATPQAAAPELPEPDGFASLDAEARAFKAAKIDPFSTRAGTSTSAIPSCGPMPRPPRF